MWKTKALKPEPDHDHTLARPCRGNEGEPQEKRPQEAAQPGPCANLFISRRRVAWRYLKGLRKGDIRCNTGYDYATGSPNRLDLNLLPLDQAPLFGRIYVSTSSLIVK